MPEQSFQGNEVAQILSPEKIQPIHYY
jgi:hypothetical protein